VALAGRYRLDERVAAGGYGEVWRATDLVLARPVAVKVLRPEVAGDAEALARFRAEARHAGSVEHEGIARVFDYDEPSPKYPAFLVMEYVDGPSLAEVLDEGPLPLGRTLDILAQAGAALAAAHEAGLVHRDIKPQNILLSGDGQVKLTDFGISLAAGAAALTSTGMVLGTTGYLAPERLEGARGTAAGDVYALGVVAYQALAGEPPFSGTPAEIADAHHSRAWPPLPAGIPAEVIALIGRLTARDPVLRPNAAQVAHRAAELRAQLGPYEPGELGESHEPGESTEPDPPTSPIRPATRSEPSQPGQNGEPWERPSTLPPARRGRDRREDLPSAWPGRLTLGAAAAAVLALAGWALISLVGPHGEHPSAAGPGRARTVEIDAARLRGQAVPVVRRELDRLGLNVRVRWRVDGQVRPGIVLAVRPGGQVPAGSVVVVTGSRLPVTEPTPGTPVTVRHHHHQGPPPGHGHGKGHGKGHKHKKGHGPGKSPTPAPTPTSTPPPTPTPTPTPTSTSPSPTTTPTPTA
jgi:serine/threonine protein kinase